MGRNTDFRVFGIHDDPVPGDPDEVKKLAQAFAEYADRAANARTQVDKNSRDSEIAQMIGRTATAIRRHTEDMVPDLDKMEASYRKAADALSVYHPLLRDAQNKAETARQKGESANTARTSAGTWKSQAASHQQTAQTEVDRQTNYVKLGLPAPTPAEITAAAKRLRDANDDVTNAGNAVTKANDDFSAAQTLLKDAQSMRDQAGSAAARALKDASKAGIHNKSWFGRMVDSFYENVVPWLKIGIAILSVVALFVGGPLTWILLGAALLVAASTVYEATQGRATMGDVFMSLLDVIPGIKQLKTAISLAKFAQRANTASKFVRAANKFKSLAAGAGTRLNRVGDWMKDTKLARGFKGEWKNAPAPTRWGKTKVGVTKYGLQYAANFGTKYATTLTAQYLGGEDVKLIQSGAMINAAAGAFVSVGGKGAGEALRDRLKFGKKIPDGNGGTTRDASTKAQQRGATDAEKAKYPAKQDAATERAADHRANENVPKAREHAADTRADATAKQTAADHAKAEAATAHDTAKAHTDDARTHQTKADEAGQRAQAHEDQRAASQKTADDARTEAGQHRADANKHTSEGNQHTAAAKQHTDDAQAHGKAAAKSDQDAATAHAKGNAEESKADGHRTAARDHEQNAAAHDAKAREHETKAQQDPANAKQHQDAAARERAAATHERSEAAQQHAKAGEAETRATQAHDQAQAHERDANASRDAQQKSHDQAAESRRNADTSHKEADAAGKKADAADARAAHAQDEANTAQVHRDTEQADAHAAQSKADTERTAAENAQTKAHELDEKATRAQNDANKAADAADKAEHRAEVKAGQQEARAQEAEARAKEHGNRAQGLDADGGYRYSSNTAKFLDTTADTIASKRHWYTGGLNSMASSLVGKTAEDLYKVNVEHKQMGAMDWAVDLGLSGSTGFAGGASQQLATKWAGQPGLLNNLDQPGHLFAHRPKPGWQDERIIEITTKRVAKMIPEAGDTVDSAMPWGVAHPTMP